MPADSAIFAASSTVTRYTVIGVEHQHRVVIGHHDAVEAPLLTQYLRQQFPRCCAGHPVDLLVGVHDRQHAGLTDRLFKRVKVYLPQHARRYIGGSVVEPGFGLAVAGKVLNGGDNTVPDIASLESPYICDTHPGNEIGVLAECLLDPAPPGVAGNIQHR